VASNWITMVQSRLPLLEKAMEATLGSARTITLEPSDQERPAPSPAPAPPPALVRSPEPSPVQEPEEPAAAETERPQALDPLEEPPTGPLSAEPPETASGETYIPPAQSQGVQQQPQRQTKDERLLEESTGLLADFFNGQVIQHADSLILQEKEPHRPQDPKPGKG